MGADYAAIVGRVEPDADLLTLRDMFGVAQEKPPIATSGSLMSMQPLVAALPKVRPEIDVSQVYVSQVDVIELGARNGLQPPENWEHRDKYHAGNATSIEVLQMKAFSQLPEAK